MDPVLLQKVNSVIAALGGSPKTGCHTASSVLPPFRHPRASHYVTGNKSQCQTPPCRGRSSRSRSPCRVRNVAQSFDDGSSGTQASPHARTALHSVRLTNCRRIRPGHEHAELSLLPQVQVEGPSADGRFRARHRRAASTSRQGDQLSVRDIEVLGPWRVAKPLAAGDVDRLEKGFQRSGIPGLHSALRTIDATLPALPDLQSWELEVENNIGCSPARRSRAVCRCDITESTGRQARRLATIIGPWRNSRLQGERDLRSIRHAFRLGGIAAARCLESEMVTARPSEMGDHAAEEGSCGHDLCHFGQSASRTLLTSTIMKPHAAWLGVEERQCDPEVQPCDQDVIVSKTCLDSKGGIEASHPAVSTCSQFDLERHWETASSEAPFAAGMKHSSQESGLDTPPLVEQARQQLPHSNRIGKQDEPVHTDIRTKSSHAKPGPAQVPGTPRCQGDECHEDGAFAHVCPPAEPPWVTKLKARSRSPLRRRRGRSDQSLDGTSKGPRSSDAAVRTVQNEPGAANTTPQLFSSRQARESKATLQLSALPACPLPRPTCKPLAASTPRFGRGGDNAALRSSPAVCSTSTDHSLPKLRYQGVAELHRAASLGASPKPQPLIHAKGDVPTQPKGTAEGIAKHPVACSQDKSSLERYMTHGDTGRVESVWNLL